ncbi:WD40 repeat domain-containing protein [Novosphingobium beihaiensis]|uniref:NACHT and WD repeat domain-containing protein n=1 Tax=Novosphingobium beihaiensis TaxID=2930389 RepID=A0ABT0BMM8_9SPHN|nr:NACHT and WD repeat domain-containing protein [Novosphingobium beihaiensis]MCJ2186233.1 NACHT and WD repeat domain-containing protein [Novosphingobium beihaiensis]
MGKKDDDLIERFKADAAIIRKSKNRPEIIELISSFVDSMSIDELEFIEQLDPFVRDFRASTGTEESAQKRTKYIFNKINSDDLPGAIAPLLAWACYHHNEDKGLAEQVYKMSRLAARRKIKYRYFHGKPGDRSKVRSGLIEEAREIDPLLAGLEGPPLNTKAASGIHLVNSPVFERSEQRYISLRQQFFGRSAELQELDDFVSENDRGLLIVSGPAGSGKSALLAKWIERRSSLSNYIAYHFISNLEPLTTSPDRIRQNLVDQIEPRLGPRPQSQKAELYSLLTSDFHTDEPLILVVDGLDESSADDVEPFLECFLGARSLRKNVYVVVSARHEKGTEQPSYISHWHARHQEGLPGKIESLQELGEQAICDWLQDKKISDDERQIKSLAKALLASTDGLPLFLTYVIQDLGKELPKIGSKADQVAFIQRTPRPFTRYVAEQLSRIRRDVGDAEWQRRILPLLATLGVTKSAISRLELAAFLEDPSLSWEHLPLGVKRWLTEAHGKWSFAHPKLARTFSEVVGLEASEVPDIGELSPFSLEILGRLVSWMKTSWNNYDGSNAQKYLYEYLFDWFPEHLAAGAIEDELEAARILKDPCFLYGRLSHDAQRVSDRLSKHCDLWNRLPREVRATKEAQRWTSFWARYEGRLRHISKLVYAVPDAFAHTVLRSLADAGIETSSCSARAKSLLTHAVTPSTLLRSWDRVHEHGVKSMLAYGDKLVSWGADGAIRFWDASGKLLTDEGEDRAHKAMSVGGVIAHGEGLVSCGGLGSIRFWDASGKRLADKGDDCAHASSIGNVFAFGEGLVSWGDRRAIRFWDASGKRLADKGDDYAHNDTINGMITYQNEIVSWDFGGAICFWDASGKRIADKGGDLAHSDEVIGMMVYENELVSWEASGAIRFWDASGKRLVGKGGDHAHWRLIESVVGHGRGLVSWDNSGVIHFWDTTGKRLASKNDNHAHKYKVGGVIVYDATLITWERSGPIHLWSDQGQLLQTVCPPDEIAAVCCANSKIYAIGSHFWVYNLNELI